MLLYIHRIAVFPQFADRTVHRSLLQAFCHMSKGCG